MDDKIAQQAAESASQPAPDGNQSYAASDFPTEAFACPYCGQMLAPTVRVCVSCHTPINPHDIAALPASLLTEAAVLRPEVRPRVRFSLLIFLMVLATSLGIAALALEALGPVKSQYVMPGIVLGSSIWVYFDALQKHVPKPLNWGIGSLLVWIVVFPWYLARRRQLAATCPFIEMDGRRFFRAILILILAGLLFTILLQVIHPMK